MPFATAINIFAIPFSLKNILRGTSVKLSLVVLCHKRESSFFLTKNKSNEKAKAVLLAEKYFEIFPSIMDSSELLDIADIGYLYNSISMIKIYIRVKKKDEYYRLDEILKICTNKKEELESLKKLNTKNTQMLDVINSCMKILNECKEKID